MADKQHLDILHRGVGVWNTWRAEKADVIPDLEDADLNMIQIPWANLAQANLRRALLWDANLNQCDLSGSDLRDASLIGAYLMRCDLRNADLRGADLTSSYLRLSYLHGANLSGAKLTGENQGGHVMGSFLDLGTCYGLEEVSFSEPTFLTEYLARAFQVAHERSLPHAAVWPEYVDAAGRRIAAYLKLLAVEPTREIVELTRELSAELIKYLATHPDALYEIRPRQFEELIAEILAGYGWEVNLTPCTRDGGYDLFAISKDSAGVKTSWIIECKKYRADRAVGLEVVRALYGTKVDLKVANMMLATTSYFSRDVQAYKSSRYDLELKDYEGVLEWLNAYKPHPSGRLYVANNRLIVPGAERDGGE